MTSHFEFMIAGAGLAGLTVAKRLSELNKSVCIIDSKGVGSGASGVPIGLANYATGRFATLTWEAEKCVSYLKSDLEEIQAKSAVQFYKQNGILRPAMDEKIQNRMLQNYNETNWPENTDAQWVKGSDLEENYPYINSDSGALWVEDGFTVNTPLYLSEMAVDLIRKGVHFDEGTLEDILLSESGWLHESTEIEASNLIVCTGASAGSFMNLELPIHPVKGQLLLLRRNDAIPFSHSISALGYIGVIDQHHFAVGSTYEHNFQDLEVTEEGKEQLLEKVRRVAPMLLEGAKIINHWSGVRASTPNRLPIIGKHPEHGDLYYYTGLGSKGLIYSSFGAKLLTDHILESLPLPVEVDINRFSKA